MNPDNPTTGEQDKLAKWLERIDDDDLSPGAKRKILEIHNSALAAEDEENYKACLHYEQQLAAEREEREIVERSRNAWRRQVAEHGKTIQQLQDQLAAAVVYPALAKVKEGKDAGGNT